MNRCLRILLGACLALCAGLASAQIEIHPLPENAPPKPVPLGAQPLTAQDAQAWLDGLVPTALRKDHLAGALVVIVQDGHLVLAHGYGQTAPGKPVDATATRFPLGRVSGLLTWTAVMQLVEQGKLDLDADVNRYLDFPLPPCGGKPVTLRALMTHTAGFANVDAQRIVGDAPDFVGNAAWVKHSLPACLGTRPRLPAWSDYDAALAGYIVQRVSGQPFDRYVVAQVLAPLGMHGADDRQPLASPPPRWVNPVAAEGLSANGAAMARFMLALLQGGSLDDATVLAPTTLGQMQQDQPAVASGLPAMALGFAHLDRNGQTILGQLGEVGSFHVALALYPQQGSGVFVMVDGTAGQSLRQQLLDGFADRYFPARPEVRQPTLARAFHDGALVAGRYASSRTPTTGFMALAGLFAQVRIDQDHDGNLVTPDLANRAGQPRRWREVAPLRWRDVNGHGHLLAHVQDGQVRWVALDPMTSQQVYLPVPAARATAWILPALWLMLLVFALVVLRWPLVAWWHGAHGRPMVLGDPAGLWSGLSRLTALTQLLFWLGWAWVLWRLGGAISPANGFGAGLRAIQLIGVVALLGGVAVLANAWVAWRSHGGWLRKGSSVALCLAWLASLWFIVSFDLLALQLRY